MPTIRPISFRPRDFVHLDPGLWFEIFVIKILSFPRQTVEEMLKKSHFEKELDPDSVYCNTAARCLIFANIC